MRRPPAKARRDGNEREIFAILRTYGLSVYPLDQPLDAVVGYGGRSYLVEVKDGPRARLTAAQEAFLEGWRGQAAVLRSEADAIAFAKSVRAAK